MYNKNICCYYIRECIMTINILLYMKMYFYYTRRCIMTINILLYMKMYFYYIRECIMTTSISIIHEDVFLLYKTMYNKIFVVII